MIGKKKRKVTGSTSVSTSDILGSKLIEYYTHTISTIPSPYMPFIHQVISTHLILHDIP